MDIIQEEISGFVCVRMSGRLDAGTTPDAEKIFEKISSKSENFATMLIVHSSLLFTVLPYSKFSLMSII